MASSPGAIFTTRRVCLGSLHEYRNRSISFVVHSLNSGRDKTVLVRAWFSVMRSAESISGVCAPKLLQEMQKVGPRSDRENLIRKIDVKCFDAQCRTRQDRLQQVDGGPFPRFRQLKRLHKSSSNFLPRLFDRRIGRIEKPPFPGPLFINQQLLCAAPGDAPEMGDLYSSQAQNVFSLPLCPKAYFSMGMFAQSPRGNSSVICLRSFSPSAM